MNKFSEKSLERLHGCHPHLIVIAEQAILITDFTVICGRRGKQDQNILYDEAKSELKFPDSKHNKMPYSLALDLAPLPIDWTNIKGFTYLAGVIMGIAHSENISLTWGGHWESLKDYGHFELKE